MRNNTDIIDGFIRINPHVIKYRNRKILLFCLKCLIIWAAIAVIVYLDRERSYMLPVGAAAGVIASLLILKKDKLINLGWSGVIESTKIKTYRVKSELIRAHGYSSMRDQNFIICRVQTDGGRKKTIKMPEEYGKVFREGDRVISIPGIAYKIDLSNRNMTLCPRCGAIFPSVNEKCVTIGCHMPTVNIDFATLST